MRSALTAPLLAALFIAVGCGDTDSAGRATDPAGSPSTSSPSTSSPSTSSPNTSSPSTAAPTGAPSVELPLPPSPSGPPSEPTDTAKQITVTGSITLPEGQPRCVNLVDEATGAIWTLTGALVEGDVEGAGPLAEGDRVRATGRVRPDTEDGAASYACSIPIAVERIARL
jgi:hypothetical protein